MDTKMKGWLYKDCNQNFYSFKDKSNTYGSLSKCKTGKKRTSTEEISLDYFLEMDFFGKKEGIKKPTKINFIYQDYDFEEELKKRGVLLEKEEGKISKIIFNNEVKIDDNTEQGLDILNILNEESDLNLKIKKLELIKTTDNLFSLKEIIGIVGYYTIKKRKDSYLQKNGKFFCRK